MTEAFHEMPLDERAAFEARRNWLAWSTLNQTWLPRLHQPPYGDRAVVRISDDVLVGVAGLVPCLAPFDQIPELRRGSQPGGFWTPEMGLFWAIDPAKHRQGYASEAGQALIEFAFRQWHVQRVIATTEYTNEASQGVMRKLGMNLCRNPLPDPFWLQVVGVLNNPGAC